MKNTKLRRTLHFVLEGKSNKEIAILENIEPCSVKYRITKLLKIFDVKNRSQLISLYLNNPPTNFPEL